MRTRHTVTILALVANLLCCGWVPAQDSIIVDEGFSRSLKKLESGEASKLSADLWNTPFAFSETSDISCSSILKMLNEQLAKLDRPLRVRFEISNGSRDYFRPFLSKPLTTWYGNAIGETETRARLKKANLSEVLMSVQNQLGVNIIWYSDTLLLSNYISSN